MQAVVHRIRIAPPLKNTSIVAHPLGTLNPLVRWIETANRTFDLHPRAKQRRHKKVSLSTLLPQPELPLVTAIDSLLFFWVSVGFWTAIADFLVLMRGTYRYVISREDIAPGPRPEQPYLHRRTGFLVEVVPNDWRLQTDFFSPSGRRRFKLKSSNIYDFCRRCGSQYSYMSA